MLTIQLMSMLHHYSTCKSPGHVKAFKERYCQRLLAGSCPRTDPLSSAHPAPHAAVLTPAPPRLPRPPPPSFPERNADPQQTYSTRTAQALSTLWNSKVSTDTFKTGTAFSCALTAIGPARSTGKSCIRPCWDSGSRSRATWCASWKSALRHRQSKGVVKGRGRGGSALIGF